MGYDGGVIVCEPRRVPHAAVDQYGILVVYKPPFWTMTTPERAKSTNKESKSPEIQNWLIAELGNRYPFLKSNPRAGLIHRLDVQTSGPILVATRPDTFEEMRFQLRKKKWYKEYLALMHGAIPPSKSCGVLNYKLLTTQERGRGWRTEVNHRKGEPSETRYQAVASYRSRMLESSRATRRFTLVKLHLITGRTHQIRVHLAEFARELGFSVHGIVGDYKYLPPDQLRDDKRLCNRVFLHAQILEFPPPKRSRWARNGNETPYRVRCPLPPELQRVLGRLERDERLTAQFSKREGFLRGLSGSPPPASVGRRGVQIREVRRNRGKSGEGADRGRDSPAGDGAAEKLPPLKRKKRMFGVGGFRPQGGKRLRGSE